MSKAKKLPVKFGYKCKQIEIKIDSRKPETINNAITQLTKPLEANQTILGMVGFIRLTEITPNA